MRVVVRQGFYCTCICVHSLHGQNKEFCSVLLGVKTWLSMYIRDSVSFGRDTNRHWSLLSGVYARGSKRSHQSALEMCNLSWTPHSSLEKDNSLNHS